MPNSSPAVAGGAVYVGGRYGKVYALNAGRGLIQQFLFDGVLIEPGDGAQPTGDGRPCAAPSFQVAGEAFDVSAADGEQREGAGTAPGSELPQVEGVRLTGQAAVPGQEPGEREPLGIAECWLQGNEGGRGGGHRAPPGPG